MNKNFLEWLKKQEYDWNIPYNHRHRKQYGGTIWMLKDVYDYWYPGTSQYSNTKVGFEWDEIIKL
jgi:hypothetical protein